MGENAQGVNLCKQEEEKEKNAKEEEKPERKAEEKEGGAIEEEREKDRTREGGIGRGRIEEERVEERTKEELERERRRFEESERENNVDMGCKLTTSSSPSNCPPITSTPRNCASTGTATHNPSEQAAFDAPLEHMPAARKSALVGSPGILPTL